MHLLLTYIAISFSCQFLLSQYVQIIRPPDDPDSSLYDIVKVADNEFWAAGENGVLLSLDTFGNVTTVDYPSVGVDILKIDRINENEWILTGKAGVIYYYNRWSDRWRVHKVPGYGKKVFYETAVFDGHTIYIAGGMSKIADSKTTLPRGFIIRSTDHGQTWEQVYSNPLAMVWDIDKVGDSLVAVIYNPLSKNRILYSTNGNKWHSKKLLSAALFHSFDEQTHMLAGGTKLNMKGAALLAQSVTFRENFETPFWWSCKKIGNSTMAVGSNGAIFLDDRVIRLPFRTHLYELVPVSGNSAIVVGSGQVIAKITINGSTLVSSD